MQHDRGALFTTFHLKRSDLEAWKRRKAVVLHYGVLMFKKSVRSYKAVFTTYGTPLLKLRYDHKTGTNCPGSIFVRKTLTRESMDKLLATDLNTFSVHMSFYPIQAKLYVLLDTGSFDTQLYL